MSTLPAGRIVSGLAMVAGLIGATVGGAQVAPRVPPRPAVGNPAPFTFPTIVTQTLPNGLRLSVIENHENPVVSVRVGLMGGPFLDAPGKEGNWLLTLNSLRDGTTTRSATDIADAASDLGTTITNLGFSTTGAGPGFVTARSLWRSALDLVADMVLNPTFPAEAIKRSQTTLVTVASQNSVLENARRLLTSELFGADHPLARIHTPATARALTHDDLAAVYATYIHPQNTVIVISGDVTLAEARAAVDMAFGSWQRGGTTVDMTVPAPAPRSTQATIYLRDLPNAAQTQIVSGILMPGRASADAPAIEAVNWLLASGSISSRLSKAFRTDRGLAYSATSRFVWRHATQPAMWNAEFSVNPALSDTAVLEWLRIVREVRDSRPVTADEIEAARTRLVDILPLALESVDAVAGAAVSVLLNGYPDTFYTDYAKHVRGLTLADAQAAVMKYYEPDRLVIAVVGDRARIEAALRATGIPVVIVDK